MAQEKILGRQINLPDVAADLPTEVVNDTTPQLGGDLDVNSFKIRTPDRATPPSGGDNNYVWLYGGDLTGGGGYAGSILAFAGAGTGGGAGGYVTINAGTTATGDDGGGIFLQAGNTSDAAGTRSGGEITITTGRGLTNSSGGNLELRAQSGTLNGGAVNIISGASTSAGDAGGITLTSGDAAAGTAGPITIQAGVGDAAAYAGGNISILSGRNDYAGGNSGYVYLQAANATQATANGGIVWIDAGNSIGGTGGNLDCTAGDSTTGTPGSISFTAGAAGAGNTNNGGNVTLVAGNAQAGYNGGNIVLTPGSGAGNLGVVSLGGNLDVNSHKIGNIATGSPDNASSYIHFNGETVNLFGGATNPAQWDSTVAILSSTDGTTGEYGVQTVTLQGQNRFGTTGPYGAGGDVVIKGGDTTGSPNTNLHGGDATLRAGSGFNNTGSFITVGGNGSITLQQAANTSGNAGAISLIGANGGTGSGQGADIVLYAGNGTDTNGAGGDITLRPGRGVGIGADGIVAINNPSGSTTEQSKLRFFEAATNGSNYVELVAQANIGTSVTWTLPAEQNTVGDPLGIDLGEYSVSTIPTASLYPNCWALVTDAANGSPYIGRVTVRSDGTDWKVIAPEGATLITP